MKKRKRCVKIFALLMAVGLLLLSGCGLSDLKKVTDIKMYTALLDRSGGLLREAIEEGADVNRLPITDGMRTENNHYERNPLRVGIWNGISLDMVKMLLEAGADVNACDVEGCPVIFYSVYRDDERLCRMMLNYDADLSLVNKQGESILEYYINTDESGLRCFFPRKSMVKLLLEAGASADEDTLQCVKRYGAYHILDLLYPMIKDSFSELQKKYLEGDVEGGNRLLEQAKQLSETDRAIAAIYGNRESINILQQKQTDFYKKEGDKKSLVELAAWNQNLETVSAMLEVNGTPYEFDKYEFEAAVYRNDNAELQEYLTNTGIIRIEDITESELSYYVEADALKTVKYILEHGYDISKGETRGGDLLNTAILTELSEMTELLLSYGLDPNVEYSGLPEDPAWLAACESGNIEILEILLERGADLDRYGEEALKTGIDFCQMDIIRLLSEKGVKVTKELYEFSQEEILSDHVKEYVKKLYEEQNQ